MGVGTFTSPGAAVGGEASQSQLVPDACINPHPRRWDTGPEHGTWGMIVMGI